MFWNDPGRINTQLDRVERVTADDIKRVANKYLVQTNRTVVITMPKPKGATTAAKQ